MTCDEDPDKGDNSAVEAYIWDNSKIFTTNITITCPVGKMLVKEKSTSTFIHIIAFCEAQVKGPFIFTLFPLP